MAVINDAFVLHSFPLPTLASGEDEAGREALHILGSLFDANGEASEKEVPQR